jgi:hypothetical protein
MNRVVIVICDSLRADLINATDAPFLSQLGRRAARFANHASVFPSTTRTSAASIATGCLPARATGSSVCRSASRIFVIACIVRRGAPCTCRPWRSGSAAPARPR